MATVIISAIHKFRRAGFFRMGLDKSQDINRDADTL